MRATVSILGILGLVAAATVTRVLLAFRASREEERRDLPGDALVPEPIYTTTQTVTIDASPARIWPWLAQMGAGRAGWYSYDRIDNGGHASSEVLMPEYQRVSPGDVFPALPHARDAFVVAEVAEPRSLVLAVPGARDTIIVSWAFFLEAMKRGRTRLIVRGRVAPSWPRMTSGPPDRTRPILIERVYSLLARLPAPLLLAIGGFGHRVMQNRQLRGIKRRAEAADSRRRGESFASVDR